MDLETVQNNVVAKLPLLKQGDYEMWRLRIEQYFQIQDYALWDIIENGNSFNPVARTTTNADATSTSTIPGPGYYRRRRFGGNDATKKTQKTLLKQMYENFNAPSTESLDSIFNRLQKIVSQLAILGENISQEDLNLKFLRILPSEWNTHIVEQEVKRTFTSSSNSGSQNMAFVTTPSSTNEVNIANVHVSTASSTVSTDSTHDNIANLSDATVYAFLANQPNRSQLVHEDLEQIHEDDLEEMDLKWQLALLSMRARKYYQRTGKKITINGSDTAGYEKSKVECFNCYKMRHFARECRGAMNQKSRARNQDNSRRTVNVEDISSKAMVAIDEAGFDWSYMADEEVPTNLAFMAFSDSEVHNTCSNTCLKSFETLKTQLDNLRVEFNKSEFNLATYKRGLASVEEQLVFYKKNEVMFCDQIAVLKRDASFKDLEINALNIQIEKLKKEKESNQIKIDNFENASKSLDKLIGSQIFDNNRKEEIKKIYIAPIIEDWVSDCDEDESEVRILKSDNVQQKPKQANQPRKVSENPSLNHLIKDCDFHDKKMVQKPVLNNVKKGTSQREVRPVWNNAMRCWLYTTQQMVINSPCLTDKKELAIPGQTATGILTGKPTIYVSLIKQFWQTATVEIVNDGEQQITVTVDGHTIAITEASVRRHL
ncbi:ribonuclease H-like domain-containing protein [Tanacetum coccineum]